MNYKKGLLAFCLIMCILFTVSCVAAGDVNDTAMASTDIMELSQSDEILTDNFKITGEYSPLSQANNADIISEINDNGTFRDLQIKINATEDGGTVNLMNDYTYNESDQEISITKAITINGNGFTINALEKSRIFTINASSKIVLNNITFVNGNSNLGGAILFNNDVSDIVINNCKFINNTATSNGGALYVNGGFIKSTIENTEFINNGAAKNGGAVYIFNSSSESLFENLTFANNNAKGADGGAINFHWELLKTRFNNITFFKNCAKNGGGAINTDQNVNDENTYVNVKFINNTASKNGGAINGYGQSYKNSFEGCSFANNSATNNGGAIYYARNIRNNVFENCSFIKNTANTGNGGVINTNMAFNNNRFNKNSFINNSAAVNGGALYVYDKFTANSIENAEFINNAATSNGGAIYIRGSSSENLFENLTFSDNKAKGADGGAINFHGQTSKTSFSNTTFFKNSANNGGGAINTDNAMNKDNTYVNVKFINNTASKNGGAINGYGQANSNTFDGCSFANNSATNNGGAIYYSKNAQSNVFENTEFINNVAAANGGAIYLSSVSNENLFENLTFANNRAKSADGGAINFHMETSQTMFNNVTFFNNSAKKSGGAINTDHNVNDDNTYVNVNFINNTASINGGAINGYGQANRNSFEGCSFANNSANIDGGAIYYKGNMKSNVFENCSFITNVAGNNGSAIFGYRASISNKFNKDLFLNNTASTSGTISINESDQNSTIRDSIFLNNQGSNIQVNSGSIQLIDNWFGNNATNYNETPNVGSVDIDNWLFLNATAETSEVKIYENSKVTFKLYSYDGSTVSDYDASKMNIKLDLTQTLGELNKNTSLIGEEILYTAKQEGNASITGKFKTASYTIGLTNSKKPTEINVTNSTVALKVNEETASGATLTPSDAGNLTYTSSNSSIAIVENGKIKAIGKGNATITVSFAGDEQYYAAENKTIEVTVTLNDASVSVNNSTLDLTVNDNFTIVATTVPEGLNVTYIPDNSGVISVNEEGVVTALKGGNATIIVKVGGDGVYAENTTAIAVKVSKIPTEIIIANATLDLKVLNITFANATLTPGEAGNLTYNSSNSSVAMVLGGVIIPASKGNAIITVSFAGNDQYLAAENKTISVTVGLNDASVTVENSTLDLKVGDTYAINATTVPSIVKLFNITYTSSDESVVTVDKNGTLTATGQGKAIITVEVGDDKIFAKNSTEIAVSVSKISTEINASPVTTVCNVIDKLIITLTDENGNPINGAQITVNLNGIKTYAADKNGQVKINIYGLVPNVYTATITYKGDTKYSNSTTAVKVTSKYAIPKLIAKSQKYKSTSKKIYKVGLKNNKGAVMKHKRVYVKVNGKVYGATTNSKGIGVFELNKLTKKGTYKAVVFYKGTKYFKKVAKNVQIVVK